MKLFKIYGMTEGATRFYYFWHMTLKHTSSLKHLASQISCQILKQH